MLARGCSCFDCMRLNASVHIAANLAHILLTGMSPLVRKDGTGENHPRHFYRQLQQQRACITLRSHDHERAHNLNQTALLSSGLAPCCQPIKGQIFQAGNKVQKQIDRMCHQRGYHNDHHHMTAPCQVHTKVFRICASFQHLDAHALSRSPCAIDQQHCCTNRYMAVNEALLAMVLTKPFCQCKSEHNTEL